MRCPVCGSDTRVSKTEQGDALPKQYLGTGIVRRWRQCKKRSCDWRFITIEQNEADLRAIPGPFVGRK